MLPHVRCRSFTFTSCAAVLFFLCTLVYLVFREEVLSSHHATIADRPPPEVAVGGMALNIPSTLYPPDVGDWAQRHWMDPSEADWVRLHRCLAKNMCNPNEMKVVLVESMYFRNAYRGDVGGEEIWALSTMSAMANLGYTVLHAESMREIVQIYQYFPDLVKIVLVDDWKAFECWKDRQTCLRSEQNPMGIPGYKILSYYFWTFPRNPLGPRWILSPEPYKLQSPTEFPSNNTYLGYSIEKTCRSTKFIPAHERPPQAWLLAKLFVYFTPIKDFVWSKEILDAVADETGVRFAMATRHENEPPSEEDKQLVSTYLPEEKHYVNHHRLPQPDFMKELARSRVLIGIGNPPISPTPWNGLCLGVPFINVVTQWDHSNPEDKSKWRSQHALAALLSPPYVYNVRRGDKQGLIDAVKAALANPIDSFIPERMTLPSIEGRLAGLVDNDWEAEQRRLFRRCEDPCGCTNPCDVHLSGIEWP